MVSGRLVLSLERQNMRVARSELFSKTDAMMSSRTLRATWEAAPRNIPIWISGAGGRPALSTRASFELRTVSAGNAAIPRPDCTAVRLASMLPLSNVTRHSQPAVRKAPSISCCQAHGPLKSTRGTGRFWSGSKLLLAAHSNGTSHFAAGIPQHEAKA